MSELLLWMSELPDEGTSDTSVTSCGCSDTNHSDVTFAMTRAARFSVSKDRLENGITREAVRTSIGASFLDAKNGSQIDLKSIPKRSIK